MMELKKYFVISSLILLTGCSFLQPKEIIVKEYITRDIPIQERPKPVNLHNVRFDVVTKETLKEFLDENEKTFGTTVFYAITVPDYENMSLNIAELRRYINQQKAIIVYYEKSLEEPKE